PGERRNEAWACLPTWAWRQVSRFGTQNSKQEGPDGSGQVASLRLGRGRSEPADPGDGPRSGRIIDDLQAPEATVRDLMKAAGDAVDRRHGDLPADLEQGLRTVRRRRPPFQPQLGYRFPCGRCPPFVQCPA